jgi:catechol 2,3-dioxygenase-like lactoylglutathione lyase family enzyme
MEPTNAVGGVRIAFFKDPDGTLLELVQGELQYHKAGTAAPVVNEQPSEDRPLVFDHVAISVINLDETLRYYRDMLGFPVLGQLFFNDSRGFVITNVQAGTSVLELFSFSSPMTARGWNPDQTMLGLKHVGFGVDDTDTVAKRLHDAGAQCTTAPDTALGDVRTAFFQDPDGNALELIDGTRAYDP